MRATFGAEYAVADDRGFWPPAWSSTKRSLWRCAFLRGLRRRMDFGRKSVSQRRSFPGSFFCAILATRNISRFAFRVYAIAGGGDAMGLTRALEAAVAKKASDDPIY